MIALLLGMILGLQDLDQAEQAYRTGRFRMAFALFQASLPEQDGLKGPVLYNLGNCAYRMGSFAEAVLHYRRAALRLPRDPRVKFNLGLAEQRLGLDAPEGESFGAALEALAGSFTPREFLWLVGGLQCAGLVGLVLLRRHRTARNFMALSVLLALAGAARLVQVQWFPGPPDGVVLAREIALRSEPHPDLPTLLKLKAGETVRVEEQSDRWVMVKHPRGSGWTERAGVGVVD